jgi:cell division protein FtsW
MDVPFLLLTLLLLAIGVVMVYSASFARAFYSESSRHNPSYYFSRQLVFALMGIAAMLVASRFPIGFYRRFAGPILAFSVALLLLVLVGGN